MLYKKPEQLAELLVDFMKIPQKFKVSEDGKQVIEPISYGRKERQEIEREDYVAEHLKSLIPWLQEDATGNLYLINPGTPLICAHMDTVGSFEAQQHVDQINIYQSDMVSCEQTTSAAVWYSKYDESHPYNKEWDVPEKVHKAFKTIEWYKEKIDIVCGTHNIWADDKCWIVLWYALRQEFWNNVSLLFTRGEETGMHWIRNFVAAYKDLMNQCTYCIVWDRRHGLDFIWEKNDYCTKEFENKVLDIIKDFWFSSVRWLASDCWHIKEVLNTFNISVWYYDPHTDWEYVVVNEYHNTYAAMRHLILNFNEKMEPPKTPSYSYQPKSLWLYGDMSRPASYDSYKYSRSRKRGSKRSWQNDILDDFTDWKKSKVKSLWIDYAFLKDVKKNYSWNNYHIKTPLVLFQEPEDLENPVYNPNYYIPSWYVSILVDSDNKRDAFAKPQATVYNLRSTETTWLDTAYESLKSAYNIVIDVQWLEINVTSDIIIWLKWEEEMVPYEFYTTPIQSSCRFFRIPKWKYWVYEDDNATQFMQELNDVEYSTEWNPAL